MIQLSKVRYQVVENEQVVITASLLNGVTPELLQVFRKGVELPNEGGASPKYQFTIEGSAGSQEIVTFFCSFPGLPAGAEVDTQVEGAAKPGIVLKQGANQEDMKFDVVAS